MKYLLGSDSITVFVDGKPYTINKQAHTYETVLKAIREKDEKALKAAVEIKNTIHTALTKVSNGSITINGGRIMHGNREIQGLVSSRIFEMLRLGLDVQPMIRFLENLMKNPSKRAVDELFGFMEACDLPITEDGHFLAYKRVRDDYKDVYSGTMSNTVGSALEMPRNLVDEDKNRTCSAGLHFCSYSYLQHFGGERVVVLKINPADVVAIPADYNNAKGRTCRYEVVDEIELEDANLPSEEKKIEAGATKSHGFENVLSDDEVVEILFLLRDEYTLAFIAQRTHVSPRTVARIRDNETYTHVSRDVVEYYNDFDDYLDDGEGY